MLKLFILVCCVFNVYAAPLIPLAAKRLLSDLEYRFKRYEDVDDENSVTASESYPYKSQPFVGYNLLKTDFVQQMTPSFFENKNNEESQRSKYTPMSAQMTINWEGNLLHENSPQDDSPSSFPDSQLYVQTPTSNQMSDYIPSQSNIKQLNINEQSSESVATIGSADQEKSDEKDYKRVFDNETVVEYIGEDDKISNKTTDVGVLPADNEASNETVEFKNLLEEARETKQQIDMLSAKLDNDSDETNITNPAKKSTTDEESLQNDISVERGVRQLLVKHLIQVQIEDHRREEALESILRHYPVTTKDLKTWNLTEGALKAIVMAKLNLLEPTARLKVDRTLLRHNIPD